MSAPAYLNGVVEAQAAGKAKEAERLAFKADESNPEYVTLREGFVPKDHPELKRFIEGQKTAQTSLDAANDQKINFRSTAARDGARTSAQTALSTAQGEEKRVRGELEKDAAEKARAVLAARSDGRNAADEVRRFQGKPAIERWNELRTEYPYLPSFSVAPAVAGGIVAAGITPRLFRAEGAIRDSARAAVDKAMAARGTVAQKRELARAESYVDSVQPKFFDDRVKGGAIIGGTIGVAPVGMDAIALPTINPEKTAGNAFVESLLDIDPRRPASASAWTSSPT